MKTYRIAVLAVISAFIVSCASSPTGTTTLAPEDEYSDVGSSSAKTTGQSVSKKRIAEIDPYEIANVSISCTTMTGFGMEQKTLVASFAPKTNEVLYDFTYQGNKMTVVLDAQDRAFLISAIKSYLDEFEAKALEREGDNDRRYGAFDGLMTWGFLTKSAKAAPKIKVGYEFEDKAPYFTMTFPESDNLLYLKENGSRVKRSGYMRWFMTRSQAAEFGDILDQAYLESTLEGQNVPTSSSDPDVY